MKGTIQKIIWSSDHGEFVVARVLFGDRERTVAGALGQVEPGMVIAGEFDEVSHPKYGKQLKPRRVVVERDFSDDALVEWLSNRVKGVGPAKAKRIVKALNGNADLLGDVDFLSGVVNRNLAKEVSKVFRDDQSLFAALGTLLNMGLTNRQANLAIQILGATVVTQVTENPYVLMRVPGIGFRQADVLAEQQGISDNDPRRLKALVEYVLQQEAQKGHTAPSVEDIIQAGIRLNVTADDVLEGIKIAEGIKVDGGDRIGFEKYHHQEAEIRSRISNGGILDIRDEFPIPSNLSDEQRKVFDLLRHKSRIISLTGGPGTGKSHVISVLVETLRRQLLIKVAAPTGKAAQRLSNTGIEASTIHRLLRWQPKTFSFFYNDKNRLDADLVIVDEASMVDVPLMYALLRAMRQNAKLLLVGDINQLPSVGPGQVFHDLINHGAPTVRLTKIFRQAEHSPIIEGAYQVLRGEWPNALSIIHPGDNDPAAPIIEIVKRYKMQGKDIQVLTPMNRGPLGVHELNKRIADVMNPQGKKTLFSVAGKPPVKLRGSVGYVGDPIICLQNSYDLGIMNGEVGVIVDIEEDYFTADFYGQSIKVGKDSWNIFSLGYAISVHRSQGSEWQNVVLVLGRDHYIMAAREILYTGLTRAKENLHLVADKKMLGMAVKRVMAKRKTWLGYWRLS